MRIDYTVQIWREGAQYVAQAMPVDVVSAGSKLPLALTGPRIEPTESLQPESNPKAGGARFGRAARHSTAITTSR